MGRYKFVKEIWGGCPSVTMLCGACSSMSDTENTPDISESKGESEEISNPVVNGEKSQMDNVNKPVSCQKRENKRTRLTKKLLAR